MLYILPLEILEERYTEQWYRWFREKAELYGVEYQYIDGEQLTSSVETGAVLDAHGTNHWKLTQMLKVIELFKTKQIKDGDKFFTMDLWHPALECIPYMSQLDGLDIEVYGFLHAGSYTTEDFAQPMQDWAKHFERGWAAICKKIFVGTEYHKLKFYDTRLDWYDVTGRYFGKIIVTGNPFDTKEILLQTNGLPLEKRENIIIFPHRWDNEKRPDVFVQWMEELYKQRQDFKVLITTSRPKFRSNSDWLLDMLYDATFPREIKEGLTKAEYYQLMSEAKVFVSTTIEENFGYCLVEAITCGAQPLVPFDYSHPEILQQDSNFMYNTKGAFLDLINVMLDNPKPVPFYYATKYDDSIYRIYKEMEVI